MRNALVALAVLAAWSAGAEDGESPRAAPPEAAPGGAFIDAKAADATGMCVGDSVAVRVARRDDLSMTFTVPPGGIVTFPLIGEVRVAGLRPEELAANLKARFVEGGHLTRPDVTVLIERFASRRAYVLGAVKSSQAVELPLGGRLTLTQAIAVAGGFLDGAEPREVRLIRRVPAQGKDEPATSVVTVDIEAITERSRTELDLALAPGDTIVVPRREEVFVLGQVKNPGAYSPGPGRWTLTMAIAKAGGFTQYARSNRVRVISRGQAGGEAKESSAVTVDVKDIINTGDLTKDVDLRPGDVVFVPESIF